MSRARDGRDITVEVIRAILGQSSSVMLSTGLAGYIHRVFRFWSNIIRQLSLLTD